MKRILLLALLAGSVLPVHSAAIPLWHWSDGHIRYFEDRGMLQTAFRSVQPYSYAGLRTITAALDSGALNRHEAAMCARLAGYAAGIDTAGASFLINGGVSFDDVAGGWVNPVLAYGFTPYLSLYSSFRIMNARNGYDGKEYAGVNAYNDQGILAYERGGIAVKIGRDYLRLGPGYAGQLLLSDASPAFDQYRVDLTRKQVRYTFWGLALNERAGMSRYVNGHRLTLRLPGKVEVGLNEMVIYGGDRAHWQLTYMNPVLFYHGYALNTSDEINTLLSLDADWQALPVLRCWAEFLVDDFQTERTKRSELEPAELGITAGAVWSGLPEIPGGSIMLEYSQITHRTYNAPNNDWEKYLHRGITTGYYLPIADTAASNDFQSLTVVWQRWWLPQFATEVTYHFVRRGEGTVQDTFNTEYLSHTVAQGYDEAVPFGTVETTNGITLAGEMAWAAWLHTRFYVTYSAVTHPGNDADAARSSGITAGLALTCGYRLK